MFETSVGKRLKEERLRLRLSQEALGEAGGVGKNAQIKYEKDERAPDTQYLVGIHQAGVDVLYVVGGVRSVSAGASQAEFDVLRQALQERGSEGGDAEITAAYTKLYQQRIASGIDPGMTITDRHRKLISAFDAASESGKKMIERVAQLEGARGRPKATNKTSVRSVEIHGDGNVIGNNNKTTNKG